MKSRHRYAASLMAITLFCCAALFLMQRVDAAGEGKITGTVKLEGAKPTMKAIDMSRDPYCAKAHENSVAKTESVVAGANGGLRNVVLYISGGLAEGAVSEAPTAVPVFDQKNCVYEPHVLALNVGQAFKITNGDQTMHNIHPLPNPMTGNIPWNQSQPPGAAPVEKSWKTAEVIPVKCNIHPWMNGYYVVVKGPYATTDENGNFTINNVPPGSYTVTAWQETYGTQTQKVTVTAGKARADFVFTAK